MSRLKSAHGNLLIIWIVVGLARPSSGLQIKSNPRAASAKKRLAHVLGLIMTPDPGLDTLLGP